MVHCAFLIAALKSDVTFSAHLKVYVPPHTIVTIHLLCQAGVCEPNMYGMSSRYSTTRRELRLTSLVAPEKRRLATSMENGGCKLITEPFSSSDEISDMPYKKPPDSVL